MSTLNLKDGTQNGNWNNPAIWVEGTPPTSRSDVVISGRADNSVIISSGRNDVQSVSINFSEPSQSATSGALQIIGGSLTVEIQLRLENYTGSALFGNSMEVGNGVTLQVYEGLIIGTGDFVNLYGDATINADITNSGTIQPYQVAGNVYINGSLSGNGTTLVTNGETLRIGDEVGPGQKLQFDVPSNPGSKLEIDSPTRFFGTISGMAPGDIINLDALSYQMAIM